MSEPDFKLHCDRLAVALEHMLDANPTFRTKPLGGPGSIARKCQDMQIAAEDQALAALEDYEIVRAKS